MQSLLIVRVPNLEDLAYGAISISQQACMFVDGLNVLNLRPTDLYEAISQAKSIWEATQKQDEEQA